MEIHNFLHDDYLRPTKYIDSDHPMIVKKSTELKREAADEVDYLRRAYLFVRDEIKHAWDVQDTRITVSASDVLREGVGICWTKSNLLAALLRAQKIPSGISYQHLTLGDTPDSGYCIHALNTVYLAGEDRWIRLDARGNKATVHAEFDLENEKLAFTIREECGEMDYHDNHPDADLRLMKLLQENENVLDVHSSMLPGEF